MAAPSSLAGLSSIGITEFDSLMTETLRKVLPGMPDIVSKNNALLSFLSKSGNIREEDGGYSIDQRLEYAENGTYKRYSGWDPLDTTPQDVFTTAVYPWRQVAISVVASGEEIRKNSGSRNRIGNLVADRVQNALHSANNQFSADIYGSGSLPKQIDGLAKLVSDTGTGIVGNIDSSTWPFWQNKIMDASTYLGAPVTSANIESAMRNFYITLTVGAEQPDLIVADNQYYDMFEGSQTSIKRYNDTQEAEAGFLTLRFKKAKVIFDGTSGMLAGKRMYFLNTKYLFLVVHSAANWTMDQERVPVNQDGVIKPILWMGNLVCSNRARQGSLVD